MRRACQLSPPIGRSRPCPAGPLKWRCASALVFVTHCTWETSFFRSWNQLLCPDAWSIPPHGALETSLQLPPRPLLLSVRHGPHSPPVKLILLPCSSAIYPLAQATTPGVILRISSPSVPTSHQAARPAQATSCLPRESTPSLHRPTPSSPSHHHLRDEAKGKGLSPPSLPLFAPSSPSSTSQPGGGFKTKSGGLFLTPNSLTTLFPLG